MKKALLLLSAPLLLGGCATYHLSTESLVQQMANTQPEKKYIYAPTLPFIPFSVEGNSLHQLTCVDKNGKEVTFEVTNRTSVRLTLADSSRTTFYFNTLPCLKDSTIAVEQDPLLRDAYQACKAAGRGKDRGAEVLAYICPMNTPAPISRAMILAAGLGTRFKPWTDRHPKALAVINGKSLLQRNVEYLQRSGIREIVVNVHHFADQIVEALRAGRGWGSEIMISDETAAVLETGGGLKKARPWLEEAPFVLMNVDILTDMDLGAMIADHFEHRPLATLAVTNRSTSRYFLFDGQDELCGWRNVQTGQERMYPKVRAN